MRIIDRTDSLRRAGERARQRVAGRPSGPNGPGWLGAAAIGIVGAIAGAIVAFLTDPGRGRARRAQLVDQAAATVRRAGRGAGQAMNR